MATKLIDPWELRPDPNYRTSVIPEHCLRLFGGNNPLERVAPEEYLVKARERCRRWRANQKAKGIPEVSRARREKKALRSSAVFA